MTTLTVNNSNHQNSNSTTNNGVAQDDADDKGDEEVIHATIGEDDLIEGLDVWEEDERDQPRRRSWDRSRGRDRRPSRDRERERDLRETLRNKRRTRSIDKRRSRSNEKRKDFRRDPSKSNKDIELDKMKAKKDNDSKILAEKEKAIKNLLDSDQCVPPGTEGEAIEIIVDKCQLQREKDKKNFQEKKVNRAPVCDRLGFIRRVVSPIRKSPVRKSPGRRSPRFSPGRRRSPITFSPERRRRSPDDRRRRTSRERNDSLERRRASRRRLRERADGRNRSRSRERRSSDRRRSSSLDKRRRSSRSPFERRGRRRTISRSPIRSPNRSRKRSPFINELARQFQNEPIIPENAGVMPMVPGMGPVGPGFIPPGGGPMIPGPPNIDPRMIPGGALLPTPVMPGMGPMGPGMHPGPMDMHPGQVMHPGAIIHPQGGPMPPGGGPPYMNYEAPGMNFDPLNRGPVHPDFGPGAPIMFNPGNPMQPLPHSMRPISPQPVPAPGPDPLFPSAMGVASRASGAVPGPKYSPNYNRPKSPSGDYRSRNKREERMKTPEPPIISDIKHNEKTSLSSLLEASVSIKDSAGLTPSFRGFRPEIIRQCERALRSLPAEDPRLKMKGRFFFNPVKDTKKETTETASNSILLRKGRTEIHWDEEENQLRAALQSASERKRVVTHQKICQTDILPSGESIGVQVDITMVDMAVQTTPIDLPEERPRGQPVDEGRGLDERRSLTDRLDWNMRETFDHSAKLRDADDLRWSLNNRDRAAWTAGRQIQAIDHMHGAAGIAVDSVGRPIIDRVIDARDMIMERGIDRGMDPRGGDPRDVDARCMDPRDVGFRGMDPRDIDPREMELRSLDRGLPPRDIDRGMAPNDLDRGMGPVDRGIGPIDRGIDFRDMDRGIIPRDLNNHALGPRDVERRMDRVINNRDLDRGMNSRNMDRGLDPRDIDRDMDPVDLDLIREHEMIMEQMTGGDNEIDEYQDHANNDFDRRKNFSGGFGGIDGRATDMMDRDNNDGSKSPVEDAEDLEIIEERLSNNPVWPQRNLGGHLNNARGGPVVKRPPFRGRIGGYRMNY